MAANGIDTQVNCWQKADCLRSAGIAFVGRYYNVRNPGKNLTKTEAGVLVAAGLTVVAVWENGFPTSADYFTSGQGSLDAGIALRMARQIGQPSGSAIYFAVDYDASAADIEGPVMKYFQAVADVFDQAPTRYDVGVYGSGAVCAATSALAGWSWLSGSTGWAASKEYDGYDIKQGATMKLCGMSVDSDEADPQTCGGFTSLA